MLEVIDQKVNGQEIVTAPEEAPETKIIDIMEALKASLATQQAPAEPKEAKKAPKTAAAAKKKTKAKAKKAAAK